MRRRRSLGGAFSPRKLFTSGAKGAWYDPSDLTTLFQDSAGATPVTAVEQSVRLMRDKSGNNNHATAPSDASRPILRALYNNFVDTTTLATQNVTTLAASYKLSFTGAGSITLSGTATGTYSAGTNTITCTAGTLTATVSGTVTNADLRLSSTSTSMPAYQLVTTSTNYDTTGFLPYLAFDGTNDYVASAAIDFSTTNKVTLCSGITKNSNTLRGVFAHLGSGSSATFRAEAPDAGLNTFTFYTTGTGTLQGSGTVVAAPATRVFTGIGDIAADINLLRLNGVQVASNTTDQGTGNYSNSVLNVGRRGDGSLFFNGRIYQFIVCGKTLSASELTSTEAYVAIKTGVTL